MQADTLSLHAQAMLPVLLARVHPTDAREQQAATMLRQWDRDARGDSAAAAIFQAWYYELLPAIVDRRAGSGAHGQLPRARPQFVRLAVSRAHAGDAGQPVV